MDDLTAVILECVQEVKQVCQGMWGPCGKPAKKIPCRTAYADESFNSDPMLCEECAEGYNEHWDEMWSSYYSGLL